MIRNRKTLLAFLRGKCGYEGKDELAEVEAFIKSELIDLVDTNGKPLEVKALWENSERMTVKAGVAVTNDDDDAEDESRLRGNRRPVVNKAARVDGAPAGKVGGRRSDDFAKKMYDAKAARGETIYSCADEAEEAGAFLRRTIAHVAGVDYAKAASDEAIIAKTSLTTNTAGSALVPEDLSTQVIELRQSAVGPERFCAVETMSRDVQGFPRETDGTTIYAPGEGSSITASDPTHDSVKLVANKLAGLCKVSSELLNDSVVSFADRITSRMSYDMRKAEERAALLGDGTSTYWSYTGLTQKPRIELAAAGYTWTTDAEKAYHPGIVVAAGNTFAEVTKANLHDVVSQVEEYDSVGDEPTWIMSRAAYNKVGQALGTGIGGVTMTEWINGVMEQRLLGYRVIFTPFMPRTDANSQIIASFGYHNLGMKCGRVRGSMAIARSEHVGFADDLIYFRILSRFAVNVHDLGTLHATPASRTFGPIVQLATTNS